MTHTPALLEAVHSLEAVPNSHCPLPPLHYVSNASQRSPTRSLELNPPPPPTHTQPPPDMSTLEE